MNDNQATVPKKQSPYNDERFNKVQDQAMEIKGLLREINETISHKLNALFGIISETPSESSVNKLSNPDPDCWIGKIMIEQEISIEECKDILERINAI